VKYVLFGLAASETLDKDETELVMGFRHLDVRGKAGVLAMLQSLTSPAPTNHKTTIQGEVGQVVQGDQEVNAPFTISVGSGKKNKKQ